MTWNYRLVRVAGDWVEMKEVYYEADGSARGYTDTEVSGDGVEDVRRTLGLMLTALDKPVLRRDKSGKLVDETP